MSAVDLKRAQAAQDRLLEQFGEDPEINGVGLTRADGGYVVKVNVRTDQAYKSIPAEIDGVSVRVQTVGRIRKRQAA
ncbi:MAG: hypothetical protein M3Q39_15350 [Actinomycetota bacterium]|nr:hypothetical protein [Actinomycetota bacterium]